MPSGHDVANWVGLALLTLRAPLQQSGMDISEDDAEIERRLLSTLAFGPYVPPDAVRAHLDATAGALSSGSPSPYIQLLCAVAELHARRPDAVPSSFRRGAELALALRYGQDVPPSLRGWLTDSVGAEPADRDHQQALEDMVAWAREHPPRRDGTASH